MPPWPFSRRREEGAGNAVDRAPLLALLEADLRQRVRRRMSRRKIAAGKPLYRPGDVADALYLIESGRLRVFIHQRGGAELVLQFLGAGEVVGEAAFMAEAPYVTGAVAIEDATVLALARRDFDDLLGTHEALLHYLATVIAARQERANARLAAESAPEETLALNLAIALAERHPDDAVLLDLDVLFGHTLLNLRLEARGVLAQVGPNTLRGLDRGGLEHYLIKHASSLRIFPAATTPEEGQSITDAHVRSGLTALRRNFGHIVIDLPHAFNEVTLAGLDLADRVLVVATPESTVLHDLAEVRRIFGDVLRVPPERVSYALNHPQAHAGLTLSEFTSATATPWIEIGHGGDAPTAAALRGDSLIGTRPSNPVSRAAAVLADEITREAREVATLAGRAV